jgi:hypothetical protein
MPIDFPSGPTTGQVYTYQGKSWIYNGISWDAPKGLSEIGAVQAFANAAARTAAIPTPTEGMVSYLNDTDALQTHNGSAWVSPFGLTHIRTVTIGSSVTTLSLTDVFSSTFDNYLITAAGGTAGGGGLVQIQIPGVTSGYKMTFLYANFNSAAQAVSGTNYSLIEYAGTIDGTNGISMELSVGNPNLPQSTTFSSNNAGNSNNYMGVMSARLSNPTQYTSINLVFSGAVTGGVVRVYGYRKA